MTEDHDSVLVERAEHITTVTLNRPRYRNAMNLGALEQIEAVIDECIENPPRAIILRASAPGFCSGIDLKESREVNPDFARKRVTTMHSVLGKLRRMPVPIIAAIDGVAVGLGCELVISADIRLATHGSTFGYPEPRVAVPSPAHHLVWLVGLARAQDLLLTARTIGAEEAASWAIVTRIEGDVEAAALKTARQIAELAPFSIAKTKENIVLSIAPGAEASSRHHIDGVHHAASMSDRKEALLAFAEKRKPIFTGE
jgi:enoyl-CoA hydratase/carnithine racemase